jgi:hypothetical protein
MKLREAVNTYLPSASLIACAAALLVLGNLVWEWPAVFVVGGAASIVARLYLKRRTPNA